MKLGWMVLAVFGQLGLAVFLFMAMAFMGGGLANGRNLKAWQVKVLDAALLAVPASCGLVIALLIRAYLKGHGPAAYLWQLMPLGGAALAGLYGAFLARVHSEG